MLVKAWLLAGAVLAGGAAGATTKCYTFLGSSSAPSALPTAWHTHYTPCATTKFSTTVVTSTIPPSSTFTTTTTVTSTLDTTTITVATPSGFLPVKSTLPSATLYNGTVESPAARRRAAQTSSLYGQDLKTPQSVACNIWTKGKCTTQTKTITSTAAVSATASTQTVTVTTTTALATATFYAACGDDNLAYINDAQQVSSATYDQVALDDTTDPYGCCVAALMFDPLVTQYGGEAVNFGYSVGTEAGYCNIFYIDHATSCPGGQAANQFDAVSDPSSGFLFVAGNTPCGEIV